MDRIRPVNELSLMTDVFIEVERLKANLEELRDQLVSKPEIAGASDAKAHCRRIFNELRSIDQLLSMRRHAKAQKLETEPEPPKPPRGGKPKLVA